MITKSFNTGSFAYTLSPSDVLETHDSGWVITGDIHADYYEWVNEFEAVHPKYGRVWGDFEDKVFADSEEGFYHFFEHHPPCEWNPKDI